MGEPRGRVKIAPRRRTSFFEQLVIEASARAWLEVASFGYLLGRV